MCCVLPRTPDSAAGPLPAPATAGKVPARSRTHTGNKFSLPRCPGGQAGGALLGRPPRCPRPRVSRCLRLPQERRTTGRVRSGWPQDSPRTGMARASPVRATGLQARGGREPRVSQPPGLAPYLQQLHVARREPAAEPVLLLAFPPAAVRDLQQREQFARGKAQPLAVPLPGEGVQGPAAGAGHGLGARAHSVACIPAEPRGLGSGSAGSQAPGAPGSRALGTRRLGVVRGSPARRGTCAPRREAETRGLLRASGDAPGPGSSQNPALGGGAGRRGRRPRRRRLGRQLPGDAERGLPPRGPVGAALARGNAQLPGEVGSGASPSAGFRGEGVAWRTWRGSWRLGGRAGAPSAARGAGQGLDQGGHAR